MDTWTLLEKAATEFGRSTAVVDGDLRLTYGQLHERAGRLAGFFRAQQVQHGDRISILDFNSHEYIESYFAAAALGAILNPINHRLSGGEVAQVLEDAGTSWLLVRGELAPLLSDAPLPAAVKGIVWIGGPPPSSSAASPHEYEAALASAPPLGEAAAVASDDAAHLYYTSGSTGRPKGVISSRSRCASSTTRDARSQPTDERSGRSRCEATPSWRATGRMRRSPPPPFPAAMLPPEDRTCGKSAGRSDRDRGARWAGRPRPYCLAARGELLRFPAPHLAGAGIFYRQMAALELRSCSTKGLLAG
jgi:acyl-CoA synthetase (AMP-forming)/AMP-acid ligase II